MKRISLSARPGFSLIEMIFVIVILGIVSSIGAEIITNTYKSYILQRAQHRGLLKTELVALQIANRLHHAIPGTVYRIKNDHTYESVESAFAGSDEDYIGLQWVSEDFDGFEAISGAGATGKARRPGWSGYCDLNTSTKNTLASPGSNFGLENTIIENLSKNTGGSSTKHLSDAVIYFPFDSQEHNISSATSTSAYEDNLTLENVSNRRMYQVYKLAWTSYALVVEGGDLYLYYNFSPSPKADYRTHPKSLILKQVSTFKFKGVGQTIRFKICKQENIGEDFNVTSCKEKAVF
jgi:prepilin-type N-terminal cleavage/methylation domain-containing protein